MASQRRRMPQLMHERIAYCIEKSGLNCKEIAERIGRERKVIYSYRDGITAPDAITICRMCEIFKVSADWLLGLEK